MDLQCAEGVFWRSLDCQFQSDRKRSRNLLGHKFGNWNEGNYVETEFLICGTDGRETVFAGLKAVNVFLSFSVADVDFPWFERTVAADHGYSGRRRREWWSGWKIIRRKPWLWGLWCRTDALKFFNDLEFFCTCENCSFWWIFWYSC